MKRFKFRLDRVIRYRQHLERMALMELAKAKLALVQTIRKIQEMDLARKNAQKDLSAQEACGMDVGSHRIFTAYLQGLDYRIASESNRLVELREAVAEKHRAAEAERIRKETLELVREKEYAKYLKQVDRAQQKASDELVSLRKGSSMPF